VVEDPVSQLHVELVAADRKVWEGEAREVTARTVEGELGILPGHTPLLGILVEGDVRIQSATGQEHTATIDSGFLSVEHNRVTIVAEAVDASSIRA
jgi:F-type H+-transporting ATPase subunit epsilon